ncbi:MAG: hypothetical protein WC314_03360 [Vulcanimicrobiota bacterium]
MWNRKPFTEQRGLTLFEGLVTAFIIFLILSAVVTLLQTSLRAMKSQQGREISEITFVQELLRRDLSDAVSVSAASGQLRIERNDYSVPWQELLVMTDNPAEVPPIQVNYQFTDGQLTRRISTNDVLEPLIELDQFEAVREASDVQVTVGFTAGQRARRLTWNFWCPAL